MASFRLTEQNFETYERGLPRLNAIRQAIAEADQEKHVYWQFRFRYDYIEESVFCGDRYYALIMFPELLQHYDAHPELQDDANITHSLLVNFRWIVEAAPEFPQISKAEIDNYFRLFRRRLLENDYSLSIYYMKRSLFYLDIDLDIASSDFYKFLESPLDSIADGKPLYYNHQVEYYLAMDEEEKALKAAEPIFSGRMKASALPHSTLHKFCRYHLLKGDHEKALSYAKQFEHTVTDDLYYLHHIGTLMALYAHTDPAHAAKLFTRHYPLFLSSKNPWLRAAFLAGAAAFAKRADAQQLLVPAESPVSGAVQAGDPAQFAQQLYRDAEEVAGKFDQRNGTSNFTDRVRTFCSGL